VAKRRLTRKEIKQPDQFVSSSVRVIAWTKGHTKYLLYGALGVMVITGLVVGWAIWQKQQRQQAEVLLYEAIKGLNSTDKSARTLAAEQALEPLQHLTQRYRETPAAALAYWHLGHLQFEQGHYTAALAAYEQARRLLPSNRGLLLPTLVGLNIGYAQESTGACHDAMASFETVLQSSVEWLHGEAFLGIGRCYEQMGATEKALDTYSRALSHTAVNGTARQAIEERLSFLGPAQPTVGGPAQGKTLQP
jgi:predicted negative regulator of RcsB-dependent stress response